jgi:two-component system sensor histidine kinase QseC
VADAAPRPWSLRQRLVLAVLGGCALVFLATAAYVYGYTRHEIDRLLDAHLAQSASLIVAQSGHELEEIDVEHAPELHERARRVAFQIWEGGSALRLHSRRAPEVRLAAREEGFSDSVIEGRRWRVFSTWDDERRYLVQVGERADARSGIARTVALGLVAALAAALPVLGIVVWLSVGRVVAPLRALGLAVEARRPEQLAPLDPRGAPREVQPLVKSLNALFERVSRLLEGTRRFTADASHELRTPLATIRTHAEVAREARSDEERRRALDNVIAGTDRATRLTGQLLTLARLEPGVAHPHVRPCDLRALARAVVADAAPFAVDRDVSVEMTDGEAVDIDADPDLLALLVRNLVDNAVRYGGTGGVVRVDVVRAGNTVTLTVTDRGPGIPAAERDKVGQRFYRVLGTGESGSGLGLSIVHRIAELHGAAVSLGPAGESAGLRASVAFPAPFRGAPSLQPAPGPGNAAQC